MGVSEPAGVCCHLLRDFYLTLSYTYVFKYIDLNDRAGVLNHEIKQKEPKVVVIYYKGSISCLVDF